MRAWLHTRSSELFVSPLYHSTRSFSAPAYATAANHMQPRTSPANGADRSCNMVIPRIFNSPWSWPRIFHSQMLPLPLEQAVQFTPSGALCIESPWIPIEPQRYGGVNPEECWGELLITGLVRMLATVFRTDVQIWRLPSSSMARHGGSGNVR